MFLNYHKNVGVGTCCLSLETYFVYERRVCKGKVQLIAATTSMVAKGKIALQNSSYVIVPVT